MAFKRRVKNIATVFCHATQAPKRNCMDEKSLRYLGPISISYTMFDWEYYMPSSTSFPPPLSMSQYPTSAPHAPLLNSHRDTSPSLSFAHIYRQAR
ncbi:hypothetical protein AGABI1DRAFT_134703 [Agaricus bisporus var. burnettii JB137-S8]|uniref:Uncharacterized protein n=1 Tax=Agaricus bisporus var. burnettii (strain JB137-S8 / ATCC MYA-4627 / FGSC 10392) TaxID=597362 RepID=K5WDZ4_AGABU|nr:uncharacterized protein AGABI1DRAFT_134703 [Agaricus bisporus var. burnettii JB137-S8]EKM73476.1 hypothetical protein AGABI1DRAFT_134703 [Agaricus bisporus var. burnettii JB137-S8]